MPIGDTTSDALERIASVIVDAIFKVHDKLGPGLLESAYEICLFHELTQRSLRVRRQVEVPIIYDGIRLDAGFRVDILVEECVIIEVKSVDKLHPVHDAQVLTYLKLMNLRLGFLVNFNVRLIKDGLRRIVY
jgi:GxxExxY protein